MKLHWGSPDHDGSFRFFHGTLRARGQTDQQCYFEHPIERWYGVSFARSFFGIILTGRTRDVRSTDPLPVVLRE